jgi:phage terminase Nu1 subunit (DNA packaging protein)
MTRQQLSEHLQVSERTIQRWVRRGMPVEILGQRLHRYRIADIQRWFDQRRAEGWK